MTTLSKISFVAEHQENIVFTVTLTYESEDNYSECTDIYSSMGEAKQSINDKVKDISKNGSCVFDSKKLTLKRGNVLYTFKINKIDASREDELSKMIDERFCFE